MAFVVEDGTIVPDANAYITATYFREYHTTRGRSVPSAPTLTDATIETWIVRASDFITQRWGTLLKGRAVSPTHTLPFPREGIIVEGTELDFDEIPTALKRACAEYAWQAQYVQDLAPKPPLPFAVNDASGNPVDASGVVTGKREKVGPIEEETTYASPTSLGIGARGSSTVPGWVIPSYPSADMLMEPLVTSSSGKVVIN